MFFFSLHLRAWFSESLDIFLPSPEEVVLRVPELSPGLDHRPALVIAGHPCTPPPPGLLILFVVVLILAIVEHLQGFDASGVARTGVEVGAVND